MDPAKMPKLTKTKRFLISGTVSTQPSLVVFHNNTSYTKNNISLDCISKDCNTISTANSNNSLKNDTNQLRNVDLGTTVQVKADVDENSNVVGVKSNDARCLRARKRNFHDVDQSVTSDRCSIHSAETAIYIGDDNSIKSAKIDLVATQVIKAPKILAVSKESPVVNSIEAKNSHKVVICSPKLERSITFDLTVYPLQVYTTVDLTNETIEKANVDETKCVSPASVAPNIEVPVIKKRVNKDVKLNSVFAEFDLTCEPYQYYASIDLTSSPDELEIVAAPENLSTNSELSFHDFDSGIAESGSSIRSAASPTSTFSSFDNEEFVTCKRFTKRVHTVRDNRGEIMYQPDQNRPESSQGMHFHVHQCVCTSPLYNPYRQPPMIAPYVPSAVPRPYNLSHYQYTQYNMPYNVPLFNANAIAHQVPSPTPTGHQIPESAVRERRTDTRDSTDTIQPRTPEDLEDYSAIANDASTENFTKFLEQGCIRAEKIAIRNQHRPCFKNIQNLCNRTKNEILKPSHTVSNIHSQGIPWATKDFIYAYVRLINCWHMLKGYLQAKDGTLGNIDRELTGDFKTCYAIWENNTKDLAEHMIRIFSNLDNNVSNPIPNRQRIANAVSPCAPIDLSVTMEVPAKNAQQPIDEFNALSESTTEPSPREEESDGASRVYMKPGSYNVPKKNNSSDNSSPSIEFFETAKNIGVHYKKLEAKKQTDANNADKDWKNAISATPNLLKKNGNFDEAARAEEEQSTVDVESVRRWLYHDHFDQQNFLYPLSDMRILLPDHSHVKVLQRPEQKDDLTKSKVMDNCVDTKKKAMYRKYNMEPPKKYIAREAEALRVLLEELEKTEFNRTLTTETSLVPDCPDSLQTIINKHRCMLYKSPFSMVQDVRRIVVNAEIFFNTDAEILRQIAEFRLVLDDTLERVFPDINFSDIGDLDDPEPNNCNKK